MAPIVEEICGSCWFAASTAYLDRLFLLVRTQLHCPIGSTARWSWSFSNCLTTSSSLLGAEGAQGCCPVSSFVFGPPMKSGEKYKERKIAVLVASLCSLEAFSDYIIFRQKEGNFAYLCFRQHTDCRSFSMEKNYVSFNIIFRQKEENFAYLCSSATYWLPLSFRLSTRCPCSSAA